MRKALSSPVFLVLVALTVLSIWSSMDFYTTAKTDRLTTILGEYVYMRKFGSKIQPIYELLCFLLVVLLWHYGTVRKNRLTKLQSFIVAISVIAYASVLLNPNSPLEIVQLVLDSLAILLFPLMLFVFLKLDEEYFANVMKVLFGAGVVFAFVRGLWLLALFAMGKGSRAFFNVNSTLSEGDVLYFYAFLQLVLFGLYIAQKDPKVLLGSFILFLVVILSFRRTWVALTLFGSGGLLFLYHFLQGSIAKRVVIVTVALASFYVLFFQVEAVQSMLGVYGERYAAIFYAFRDNPTTEGLGSDSGHKFESTLSMTIALSRLGFFGVGLGGKFPTVLALDKWTDFGFHNVYADTLMRHGIVFFVLLAVLVVYSVVALGAIVLSHAKVSRGYFVVRLSVVLFLVLFFGVLYYNATWFKFDYAKFNFFLVPILAFALRFRPDNYALFLPTSDEDEEEDEDEPEDAEHNHSPEHVEK